MGSDDLFNGLQGGRELIDWFGRVPRFHDAELLRIDLSSANGGSLHVHAWNLTDVVDSEGFYVTDKHALVTVSFVNVRRIDLSEFHLPGIISSMEFEDAKPGTEVSWTSSYGVDGSILAETVLFEVRPGKPTPISTAVLKATR